MSKITLGTCRWINKEHFPVGMYSHSMRGTKVAMTEGQWLFSKLPECSAPKTQMTAPRLMHALLIYPPTQCGKHNICDIIKWCHNCLLPSFSEKTMHMCRGALLAVLSTHQCPYQMNLTNPIATHKPACQFHIPNFKPVTLSPRYFSIPSFWSLKFIKI